MADVPDGIRFSISQVKNGPWIVVDESNRKQLVASSPCMEVAEMIVALLNGDVQRAIDSREATLNALRVGFNLYIPE